MTAEQAFLKAIELSQGKISALITLREVIELAKYLQQDITE